MNRIVGSGFLAALLGLTGMLYSAAGSAELSQSYANRANKWETTVQVRYLDGRSVGFDSGGTVELDNEPGFGFGFGYNFNQHLALHADISWASIDYKASTPARSYTSRLDTASTQFNLTYYLLSGPLTPFVAGGLGWTWVDSNIPSGPSGIYCDPWTYYCYPYQSTYNDTAFSYNAALGLRWDITRSYFLRASVGKLWIDFDRASGTPSFTNGRVDFGFMF